MSPYSGLQNPIKVCSKSVLAFNSPTFLLSGWRLEAGAVQAKLGALLLVGAKEA